MWETRLISLYCAVSDNSSTIESVMQRQSNNFRPQFSDEECITVCLWGIMQRRFEQKAIYRYTKNHLGEWFPKLPSYQAFSRRLSALAPAFQALTEIWLEQLPDGLDLDRDFLVDSCPIILAKQARSGRAKVASEICGKSYNSSRDEYYYGVKLHAFAQRNPGCLPSPKALMIAPAPEHDLATAKQVMRDFCPISCGTLYADKAYIDDEWAQLLHTEYDIRICTPRKKKKGDTLYSGDAFSTFVSIRRQPN